MIGKTRFFEITFYFLRGRSESKCEVIITDERVNLGDEKGMQVPCEYQFVGKDKRICFLSKIILNKKGNCINCMNFHRQFE